MTRVDLEEVDRNPWRYWRQNQNGIREALESGDIDTVRRGSYAFVEAAKTNNIQKLSPSFARVARSRLSVNDTITRVNTIGGVGGALLSGDSATRERLMNQPVVEELTEAANTVETDLSENALLTLSMVALERPDLLIDESGAISTCIEKMATSGKRATYAAFSLANVADYDSAVLDDHFLDFRKHIDPSANERQLAALTYCLSQTVPEQGLRVSALEWTLQTIDYCCQVASDQRINASLRALLFESLAALSARWPEIVDNTRVIELVEETLSLRDSKGLTSDGGEGKTPVAVAEAAVELAVVLPREELGLDGNALIALEEVTTDPEIRTAVRRLRKGAATLTLEEIFGEFEVSVEHVDKVVSYDISDSINVNINSDGAQNVYYGSESGSGI